MGKNPTDRGKSGTKRSLLTDGSGVPIGLAVAGANRNDFKMARETIESIAVERPDPTAEAPQGMCLGKGYDDDEVRDLLDEFGFTAHIRTRGEEAQALKHECMCIGISTVFYHSAVGRGYEGPEASPPPSG